MAKVNKIQAKAEPITKYYAPEELTEALFFFWDGFERSTMNFFLVKDTCRQVMADKSLEGELTLGIRRLEWSGGQQRVFQAFMEHERVLPHKIDANHLLFMTKGVPVHLYIYDENPCLEALDIVFYQNDTFNTPNPFDRFCKEFDHE